MQERIRARFASIYPKGSVKTQLLCFSTADNEHFPDDHHGPYFRNMMRLSLERPSQPFSIWHSLTTRSRTAFGHVRINTTSKDVELHQKPRCGLSLMIFGRPCTWKSNFLNYVKSSMDPPMNKFISENEWNDQSPKVVDNLGGSIGTNIEIVNQMAGVGGQINNEFTSWHGGWFNKQNPGSLLTALGDSRIQGKHYRDVADLETVPHNDFSIQGSGTLNDCQKFLQSILNTGMVSRLTFFYSDTVGIPTPDSSIHFEWKNWKEYFEKWKIVFMRAHNKDNPVTFEISLPKNENFEKETAIKQDKLDVLLDSEHSQIDMDEVFSIRGVKSRSSTFDIYSAYTQTLKNLKDAVTTTGNPHLEETKSRMNFIFNNVLVDVVLGRLMLISSTAPELASYLDSRIRNTKFGKVCPIPAIEEDILIASNIVKLSIKTTDAFTEYFCQQKQKFNVTKKAHNRINDVKSRSFDVKSRSPSRIICHKFLKMRSTDKSLPKSSLLQRCNQTCAKEQEIWNQSIDDLVKIKVLTKERTGNRGYKISYTGEIDSSSLHCKRTLDLEDVELRELSTSKIGTTILADLGSSHQDKFMTPTSTQEPNEYSEDEDDENKDSEDEDDENEDSEDIHDTDGDGFGKDNPVGQKSSKYQIGDTVRCRQSTNKVWKHGVVCHVNSQSIPSIQIHGDTTPYLFNIIELHNESDFKNENARGTKNDGLWEKVHRLKNDKNPLFHVTPKRQSVGGRGTKRRSTQNTVVIAKKRKKYKPKKRAVRKDFN